MDALRIYDYLTQSRERVLEAVRALTPELYKREFPFGLKTIAATLAHIMISEWYYIERLTGRDVPPYDQWEIKYENPPPFEVIERAWREQAQRTRAALAAEKDWNRRIAYLGFPDDTRGHRRYRISATAGEFMTQLSFHEIHHRAQIMAMLRMIPGAGAGAGGHAVQDIDYNDLMFERTLHTTP